MFSETHARWSDDPTEGLVARGHPWVLIRWLFARQCIHWLDAFTVFDAWQTALRKKKRYVELFASIRSKTEDALDRLGLQGARAESLGKASRYTALQFPPHIQQPPSNIARSISSLEQARTAFRAGDSGWPLVEAAVSSGWIDPTALGAAFIAAPSIPDRTTGCAHYLGPIASALLKRQTRLQRAMAKISIVSRDELDPDADAQELRYVVRGWARELMTIRQAVRLLESAPECCLLGESPDTRQFILLARRYRQYLPSFTGTTTWLSQRSHDSPPPADSDERSLRTQLTDSDFVLRAVEHVCTDAAVPCGLTESAVQDSRWEAIYTFLLREPDLHLVTRGLFLRFCRCLEEISRGDLDTESIIALHLDDTGASDPIKSRLSAILDTPLTSEDAHGTAALITDLILESDASSLAVTPHRVASFDTSGSATLKRSSGAPTRTRVTTRDTNRVRQMIAANAKGRFDALMHENPNSYVQLDLDINRSPAFSISAGLHASSGGSARDCISGVDRTWHPFPIERLVPPIHHAVIISDVGTGKTTLLRYLQHTITDSTDRIALYFDTSNLVSAIPLSWPRFLASIVALLFPQREEPRLEAALKKAYDQSQIVFLIDGLEKLGTHGGPADSLFRQLLRLAEGNVVVGASRPIGSRSLEEIAGVSTLRLRPFSADHVAQYFGKQLHRARAMCLGDDRILRHPVYAYVARDALSADSQFRAGSSWDLYDAFARQAFETQCSRDRGATGMRATFRIRERLDRIAYSSLDRAEGSLGEVPLALYLSEEGGDLALEAVRRMGLIDQSTRPESGRVASIKFTHPTLHAYLAARWAHDKSELVDHILDNSWDPKWRLVIEFLAGALGESVIGRLYSADVHANGLYSELFLALELAAHARPSRAVEERLLADLIKGPLAGTVVPYSAELEADLLYSPMPLVHVSGGREQPFLVEAIRALAQARTRRSTAMAWAMVDAMVRTGLYTDMLADQVIMQNLYDAHRCEQLLAFIDQCRVTEMRPDSDVHRALLDAGACCAFALLGAWLPLMTPALFREVVTTVKRATSWRSELGWSAALSVLERVAPMLAADDVEDMVTRPTTNPETAGACAMHMLQGGSKHLTDPMVRKLLRPLVDTYCREPAWYTQGIAMLLEEYSERLGRRDVERVVRAAVKAYRRASRNERAAHGALIARLLRGKAGHLIERLATARRAMKIEILTALTCVAAELTDEQMCIVVDQLERPEVCGEALLCVAAARPSDPGVVELLLNGLRGDGLEMRRASMKAFGCWRDYRSPMDLQVMIELLGDAECDDDAADACIECFDELDAPQVRALLRYCTDGRFRRWRWQRDALSALSGKLREDERRWVERRLIRLAGRRRLVGSVRDAVCELLLLCDPAEASEEAVRAMLRCLQSIDYDVPVIAYEKLKEMQALGRLRGLERSDPGD